MECTTGKEREGKEESGGLMWRSRSSPLGGRLESRSLSGHICFSDIFWIFTAASVNSSSTSYSDLIRRSSKNICFSFAVWLYVTHTPLNTT